MALLDRDQDGLHRVAASLPEGTECLVLVCDVTDPGDCQGSIDRVVSTWGGVDVLVNNAGTSHRSLLVETELAVIRRVMEVNFFGAVHCTQAALPSLLDRRGVVVAISSVAGFAPLVGRTGYSASKHALSGFFASLRAEVGRRGVGVVVVYPSFVATALERTAVDGRGQPLGGGPRLMAGRPQAPEDVAEAVVRAAAQRLRVLLPSLLARLSWWISRLWPALYERLMLRTQGGEFEGLG